MSASIYQSDIICYIKTFRTLVFSQENRFMGEALNAGGGPNGRLWDFAGLVPGITIL